MKQPLYHWCQQQLAKVSFQRGILYAQKASHGLAIAAFTQALNQGYAHPEKALVLRGISRIQLNEIEDAIADFEAVIPPAQPEAPQAAFEDASQDTPTDSPPPNFTLAQAHYHRGRLRQQAANEAGALADWSEAIAHWPEYPQPHYRRALVHLSQGQHALALADLETALTSDPTLFVAYLHRGNLRHQLGDIPGAVADWEIAVCNDFTLEEAKQKLANVKQARYDATLSAVLAEPLAEKGLTAEVAHNDTQLDIHIHRKLGTGVNYYTLPDLIREHLVPLQLANVSQFQLIGHLADVNRPEWSQSYDLYKGQPCPPSNWQAAFSTLVVFPPFGIPAFIQAANVKKYYERGQYIKALNASKAVKGLCVAGSVTLGFFTLLPLGYAAYDSMQETPTFRVAEQVKNTTHRPYHEIWGDESEL